jgi:hypothetical protein
MGEALYGAVRDDEGRWIPGIVRSGSTAEIAVGFIGVPPCIERLSEV